MCALWMIRTSGTVITVLGFKFPHTLESYAILTVTQTWRVQMKSEYMAPEPGVVVQPTKRDDVIAVVQTIGGLILLAGLMVLVG